MKPVTICSLCRLASQAGMAAQQHPGKDKEQHAEELQVSSATDVGRKENRLCTVCLAGGVPVADPRRTDRPYRPMQEDAVQTPRRLAQEWSHADPQAAAAAAPGVDSTLTERRQVGTLHATPACSLSSVLYLFFGSNLVAASAGLTC